MLLDLFNSNLAGSDGRVKGILACCFCFFFPLILLEERFGLFRCSIHFLSHPDFSTSKIKHIGCLNFFCCLGLSNSSDFTNNLFELILSLQSPLFYLTCGCGSTFGFGPTPWKSWLIVHPPFFLNPLTQSLLPSLQLCLPAGSYFSQISHWHSPFSLFSMRGILFSLPGRNALMLSLFFPLWLFVSALIIHFLLH